MAIVSVSDIASGLSVAQQKRFLKNITAPKAAGAYQSAWLATGQPGAGSAPPAYTAGSGYACDRTNVGALGQANAAVQNWLARLSASGSQIGTLIIADRLWHCAGMGFAVSTYTVTTPGSLPARITDAGAGCELWVEQNVAAGAASGTLTANYLNTLGQAKAGVIPAVVSAPVIGQMQPVPLVAGDLGISQLTSVANSATWTSGSWGMTILKRLGQIEIPILGAGQSQDWTKCLAPIPADACLFFYWLAAGTTAPVILGNAWVMDK